MEKALIAVISIVGLSALLISVQAKTVVYPKMFVITGLVVSLDAPNNRITINKTETGDEKIFIAKERKCLSGVKIGQMVRIKFAEGKNVAVSIKKLGTKKPAINLPE